MANLAKCPSCGAKNPSDAKRCGSCGSAIEAMKQVHSVDRERERRYQQEGFSVKWAAMAMGMQALLTLLVIVALPAAIGSIDFEGYYGMGLTIPVWFVGGLFVGLISPGKTFIEPVIASMVVAVPTLFYQYNGMFGALGPGQTVRTMPIFMYAIMAMIAVVFTLVGSYVGERIQMGPDGEAA